jgi:hypothetical protein
VNFVLPAVETDAVLAALQRLRAYHSNPENWCNSGMTGANGSVCIAGAMGRVCFSESAAVARYLKTALPDAARDAPDPIIHFNERMGTTHGDLLAMYDRAIAARRKELNRE